MLVQIQDGDEGADGGDEGGQQDPQQLGGDLPDQPVVRVAVGQPAHGDDRVPAELVLDDCCDQFGGGAACGGGGGVRTRRDGDGQIEDDGPDGVPLFEGQAVDGVDEHQLQVEGDAEYEPVGHAQPELDEPRAGHCEGSLLGQEREGGEKETYHTRTGEINAPFVSRTQMQTDGVGLDLLRMTP